MAQDKEITFGDNLIQNPIPDTLLSPWDTSGVQIITTPAGKAFEISPGGHMLQVIESTVELAGRFLLEVSLGTDPSVPWGKLYIVFIVRYVDETFSKILVPLHTQDGQETFIDPMGRVIISTQIFHPAKQMDNITVFVVNASASPLNIYSITLKEGYSEITLSNYNVDQVIGTVIERSTETIRLAVGSLGGENIVSNGRGYHGLYGWQPLSGTLSTAEDSLLSRHKLISQGAFTQYEIPLINKTFGLSFLIKTNNADVQVSLYEQYEGSISTAEDVLTIDDTLNTSEWTYVEYYFIPHANSRTCFLGFSGASLFEVTDIQIKQGDLLTQWTPNGKEFYSSEIEIYEDKIYLKSGEVIVGGQGVLRIQNDQGQDLFILNSSGMVVSGTSGAQRLEIGSDEFGDPYLHVFNNDGTEKLRIKKDGTYYGGHTKLVEYQVGDRIGVGIFGG